MFFNYPNLTRGIAVQISTKYITNTTLIINFVNYKLGYHNIISLKCGIYRDYNGDYKKLRWGYQPRCVSVVVPSQCLWSDAVWLVVVALYVGTTRNVDVVDSGVATIGHFGTTRGEYRDGFYCVYLDIGSTRSR